MQAAADLGSLAQAGIPAISIVQTQYLGRSTIASKPIEQGQLIMRCMPYASVMRESQRTQRCQFCWKKQDSQLKRCSACKWAYFCSSECMVS